MADYKEMTPQELLKILLPYQPYFESSEEGGVTLSGGDPIMQPEFTKAFFKLCRKNKIHTTMDTSCFTVPCQLDELMPVTDLWMVSLKHFDEKKHRQLTGVTNKPILENIRYLSKNKARIWFRYVVLPGWTDTRENLKALREFLKEVKFEKIELLPYHTFGVYKWKNLGQPYHLGKAKPPSDKSCLKIKAMLEKEGHHVVLNERV